MRLGLWYRKFDEKGYPLLVLVVLFFALTVMGVFWKNFKGTGLNGFYCALAIYFFIRKRSRKELADGPDAAR